MAHPGTARQWYRVLYSPHIRNKHHQKASDGMSTSSKLDQLLPMLTHRDVLHISCSWTQRYIRCFVCLATWVCARAGFDLFNSTTRLLFYLETRKLTWPMAEPIAGSVLPQQFYTLNVVLCWCLSRLRSCYRMLDQSTYTKTNCEFLATFRSISGFIASPKNQAVNFTGIIHVVVIPEDFPNI